MKGVNKDVVFKKLDEKKLPMESKKINDAYTKLMKNVNKKPASKKFAMESKKIDDAYDKLMKDLKKDLTKKKKSDEAYKRLSKEHAKEFYKDNEPSKKTKFKRDVELERKIFNYMRTGVMPEGLDDDKINAYNEAKSAWEDEQDDEEEEEEEEGEEIYYKKKYEKYKRKHEDVKDKYQDLGDRLEDEEPEPGPSDENAVRLMLMLAAMNQKIDAIMKVLNVVPDPNIGKPRGTTKANAIKLQK